MNHIKILINKNILLKGYIFKRLPMDRIANSKDLIGIIAKYSIENVWTYETDCISIKLTGYVKSLTQEHAIYKIFSHHIVYITKIFKLLSKTWRIIYLNREIAYDANCIKCKLFYDYMWSNIFNNEPDAKFIDTIPECYEHFPTQKELLSALLISNYDEYQRFILIPAHTLILTMLNIKIKNIEFI